MSKFQIPDTPRLVDPAELAGQTFKVLTIHVPFAQLLVMGIKMFETRGWPTDYRGPLVIHAGKTWKPGTVRDWERAVAFITRPGVGSRLGDLAKHIAAWDVQDTLGKALGIVNVVDCQQMMQAPDEIEDEFGGFGPGRYGFRCATPCPFTTPVPLRGMQGLFDYQFPAVEVPAGPAPF